MFDMATFSKKIFIFCLMTLLAIPLSGEVFAQSSNEVLTSTGTTTQSILSTDASTDNELWYRSERVFGDIDVGDFVVGPGKSEIEVNPGETIIQ